MLIGWQDPPAWDPSDRQEAAPPGRGKFLVKVGGRPGIPVHVGADRGRARDQRHQQAVARAQPPERASTPNWTAA